MVACLQAQAVPLALFLKELGLEHFEQKLKTLGVDSVCDLAYVEKQDIGDSGMIVKQRKFFHHRPPVPEADPSRTSEAIAPLLKELGLECIEGKLKTLGVDSVGDLAWVEDEDCIDSGLTIIQQRKFFHHRPPVPEAEPSETFSEWVA